MARGEARPGARRSRGAASACAPPAAPAAPARDAHATALTRRERQVALLVAIGHSRAHVAGLLRLTPDEVSGHLAAVRAKLRERRRLALGPLPG